MSSRVFVTLFLAATSTPLLAAISEPQWPAGATNDNDPRVVAFYQAQCQQWATEGQMAGQNQSDYVAKCLTNAPSIWPVGQEQGGPGE